MTASGALILTKACIEAKFKEKDAMRKLKVGNNVPSTIARKISLRRQVVRPLSSVDVQSVAAGISITCTFTDRSQVGTMCTCA